FTRFSPDGKLLVVSSTVWDVEKGEALHSNIRLDGEMLVPPSFSPDGKWIAATSKNGIAQVWDAHTGQPIGAPLRHMDPAVERVLNATFNADGSELATTTKDGHVRVWDIATGRLITELPSGSALPVAFSGAGTRLACLS